MAFDKDNFFNSVLGGTAVAEPPKTIPKPKEFDVDDFMGKVVPQQPVLLKGTFAPRGKPMQLTAGKPPTKLDKLRYSIADKTGLFAPDISPIGRPKDRIEQPFKTLGQVGARQLGETVSGMGLRIPDILANKISGEDTLAEAIDKLTGFHPTPKEKGGGEATKFVWELQTIARGVHPAIAKLPVRQALKTILGSGITFGTRKLNEEIAKKIIKNEPIDWKGIHFEGGIGTIFGAGQVGLGKLLRFVRGVKAFDQTVSASDHATITRKASRAEINKALKNRAKNPDEWLRVQKKYSGFGTVGDQKPTPTKPLPVKDFGKHPLAKPIAQPKVAPIPKQPTPKPTKKPPKLYTLKEGEKAITKIERETLKKMGYSLPDIASMSPDKARGLLNVEITEKPAKELAKERVKRKLLGMDLSKEAAEKLAGQTGGFIEGYGNKYKVWNKPPESPFPKKPSVSKQIAEKDLDIEHIVERGEKRKMGATPYELYRLRLPNDRKFDIIKTGREWSISGYKVDEVNYGKDKYKLVYNDTSRKKQIQKILDAYNAGFFGKPISTSKQAPQHTTERATPESQIPQTIKKHKVDILPRKNEILTQLDEAIKNAPTEKDYNFDKHGKLHFEINGGMNIYNNKGALERVRKNVQKLPKTEYIPTTPPKITPKTPAASKKEKFDNLVRTEDKSLFTDGRVLIKGQPPPKTKYDSTSTSPVAKKMTDDILSAKTVPATLSHYGIKVPEGGEGTSTRPIANIATEQYETDLKPVVIFKTQDGKYVHYDQNRFNAIRNRYPGAEYGISESGQLIAKQSGEPVAALMGIAHEGGVLADKPIIEASKPRLPKKEKISKEEIKPKQETKPSLQELRKQTSKATADYTIYESDKVEGGLDLNSKLYVMYHSGIPLKKGGMSITDWKTSRLFGWDSNDKAIAYAKELTEAGYNNVRIILADSKWDARRAAKKQAPAKDITKVISKHKGFVDLTPIAEAGQQTRTALQGAHKVVTRFTGLDPEVRKTLIAYEEELRALPHKIGAESVDKLGHITKEQEDIIRAHREQQSKNPLPQELTKDYKTYETRIERREKRFKELGYKPDWPQRYRQRLEKYRERLLKKEDYDPEQMELLEQAIEDAKDLRYLHHYYKKLPKHKQIANWMRRRISRKPKGLLGRKIPTYEKAKELGLEPAPLAVEDAHAEWSLARAEEAARLIDAINKNPNLSQWEDSAPSDWVRLSPEIFPEAVQKQMWAKGGKIQGRMRFRVYPQPVADALAELTYVGNPHFLTRIYDKFNNAMKIIGFYNPFVMTSYDLHQGWRAAGVKFFLNIPKAVKIRIAGKFAEQQRTLPDKILQRAFKNWLHKDKTYQKLRKAGLFNNVMSLQPAIEDTTQMMLDQVQKNWGVRAAKQAGKWLNPVHIVKDLRKFNDVTTWNMDEILRIACYKAIKNTSMTKGMSDFEKIELANDFMANYGKMPKKTRQVMNRGIFTPTYKVSMARILAKLWKNPWRFKGPLLRHYAFKTFLWAGLPVVVAHLFKWLYNKDVEVKLERGYRLVVTDPKSKRERVFAVSSPLLEDTKFTQRGWLQSLEANLAAAPNFLLRVLRGPKWYRKHDKYGEFFKLGTPVHRDIINWTDKDKSKAEKFLTQFAIAFAYHRDKRSEKRELSIKSAAEALSLWVNWKAQARDIDRTLQTFLGRFFMNKKELRREIRKRVDSSGYWSDEEKKKQVKMLKEELKRR